ncbi:MAG: hypothetical protein TECD_01180 [Hyphomicrobiaceae bacterium hypho_1]
MFEFKSHAKIKYLDGEFKVLIPGEFVRCAISGKQIPLTDLKYWSVSRQEAYYSAKESLEQYKKDIESID